jgi:UDP-N-acetylglucosamine 2-epimerase (non-hydrolysing)
VKVVSVVGARPQFVKLAPIDSAFRESGIQHIIIHTGQHYDPEMSESFFKELNISPAQFNLGVGSGSHAAQTAEMMKGIEAILLETEPDWLLVFGDTNSTLAGALAAVKIHIPVAHLEAGLRSFNRRMPEEHNRILTDHAADLLLAPTPLAISHLKNEGLGAKSLLVGDVMTDVCLNTLASVKKERPTLPEDFSGKGLSKETLPDNGYIVATIHRADNTDDPQRLAEILHGLQDLPIPVILMAHPRLVSKSKDAGLSLEGGSVKVVKPTSYPVMVDLVSRAHSVITDSGGLQKEAYLLGTMCTTIRTETEWPETLADQWNVLTPDVRDLTSIVMRQRPSAARTSPYGDGRAAYAVVDALKNFR